MMDRNTGQAGTGSGRGAALWRRMIARLRWNGIVRLDFEKARKNGDSALGDDRLRGKGWEREGHGRLLFSSCILGGLGVLGPRAAPSGADGALRVRARSCEALAVVQIRCAALAAALPPIYGLLAAVDRHRGAAVVAAARGRAPLLAAVVASASGAADGTGAGARLQQQVGSMARDVGMGAVVGAQRAAALRPRPLPGSCPLAPRTHCAAPAIQLAHVLRAAAAPAAESGTAIHAAHVADAPAAVEAVHACWPYLLAALQRTGQQARRRDTPAAAAACATFGTASHYCTSRQRQRLGSRCRCSTQHRCCPAPRSAGLHGRQKHAWSTAAQTAVPLCASCTAKSGQHPAGAVGSICAAGWDKERAAARQLTHDGCAAIFEGAEVSSIAAAAHGVSHRAAARISAALGGWVEAGVAACAGAACRCATM